MEGFTGDIKINSKGEWGRNLFPTRVVFHQDEIWEDSNIKSVSEYPIKKNKRVEMESPGDLDPDIFYNQLSQRRKKVKVDLKTLGESGLEHQRRQDDTLFQPMGRPGVSSDGNIKHRNGARKVWCCQRWGQKLRTVWDKMEIIAKLTSIIAIEMKIFKKCYKYVKSFKLHQS